MLGQRLTVAVGRGKKPHRAVWYHVTLRGVEGAYLETDCGLCLGFLPFDGSTVEVERSEWREIEEGGGYCQRCVAVMSAAFEGRSRKRAWCLPRPKAERAPTFAEVKRRRERDALHEKFSETLFGLPLSEVRRRGFVRTGRGRGARWRLGAPDGSEGPGAA